jgi:hypothetical protein
MSLSYCNRICVLSDPLLQLRKGFLGGSTGGCFANRLVALFQSSARGYYNSIFAILFGVPSTSAHNVSRPIDVSV